MDNDAILLQVRGGELVGVGSWVYVWLRLGHSRPVVYVGSTGVPPVVRTWLHLHDADPDVGRMMARYPDAAREPLDVLAFPVVELASRGAVKSAVVERIEANGWLAENYVGDHADLLPESGLVDSTVDRIFEQIAEHVRANLPR